MPDEIGCLGCEAFVGGVRKGYGRAVSAVGVESWGTVLAVRRTLVLADT